MKTFKYLLWALLATFVATGCSDDATYTPGAEEDPDNYGVYFPTQTTSTEVEVDPADKAEVTYKVRRTNALEAITVPVVITTSEEGIFDIAPIVFGPGESETEFTVNFEKAVEGTTYTCDIRIEDPHYISLYGPRDTGLSFSVIRAGWELVTSADGSATKGKWRDALLSDVYSLNTADFNPYPEIDVEIFQRTDIPGYYRMKVYGNALVTAMAGGASVSFEGRDVYTIIDARDPQKVYIPYQSTGLTLSSNDGELRIASDVAENFSMDESTGQYGTLENGVITFPAQSIMLELENSAGAFYYGNRSGMLRILLPGIVVPDYTLSLSKSESVNGVVEITATLAADIAKMKYAIFEGALDEGQASLKAQELDAQGKFDGELDQTGTIRIEGLETGKYTLIGCAYDAEGIMHNYASVNFGYIAAGEEKPIVLTMGLEATNEYAGEGITPDNSAKFYVYGDDIESVTFGLFRTSKIAGIDQNALLDAEGLAFTAEQIEALNTKQVSFMLTGLNGNSDYTLLLRADNGYITRIFSATYHTTGTFNPGLESGYTYSDFLPEAQQPTLDQLTSTTWNYYAIDATQTSNLVRHRIGQVTMTRNEAVSAEKQKTAVSIKGLSGIEFESGGDILGYYIPGESAYKGYVGALALETSQEETSGIYQNQQLFTGFVPTDFSNVYFGELIYMGAIADGYLYCVPSPYILEQTQVSFQYFFTGTTSSITTLMYDMLLVDPDKDLGGIPSAVTSQIDAVRRAALERFMPTNFVELPEVSGAAGYLETVLPELPRNLVGEMRSASAPEAKHVKARTSIVNRQAPADAGRGESVHRSLRVK